MKFIVTCLFSLALLNATAQKLNPKINTNDFVFDCMKPNGEMPHKEMVLWLPYNLWEIVGSQMKASKEYLDELGNEMKKYNLFCVVDYTMVGSKLYFKTEEELRKTLRFTDSAKNVFTPLDNEKLSPASKQMVEILSPILGQLFGQFGEGMKLFLFDAKQINGNPSINVAQKNNFTLSWDDIKVKWVLPFASVLAPKHCPIDNEEMKGTWNFCPEHGVKLEQ